MKIPLNGKHLVEQMKGYLEEQGINLSEKEVYKKLIEFNFIDEFGNPTKFALENEFISLSRKGDR